jgi:hypothetical protein
VEITNKLELDNEVRMLQGNINRICVADNLDEICKMYVFALKRLEEIYKFNVGKIVENI